MKCLGKCKTAPCLQTDVLKMKDNFCLVSPTKWTLSHWQRILGQDSPDPLLHHLPKDHNNHRPTMSHLHIRQWGSGHHCHRLNGVFLKM